MCASVEPNEEGVLLTTKTMRTEEKRVAVVILNWNGAKMLQRYLPSVMQYSEDEADVWVVDNASTDESVDMLQCSFPKVRVVQLDRNYGFAEGYNRGLAMIDRPYFVLLNSDVEVGHHWLTPLVELLDSHQEVAAAQPKLLSVAERESFEYAGACGGLIDRWGYPYCRGRVLQTVERDEGQYDYQMDVTWASGACMMVRASDYWEVGGLDARFFAHQEEIDLCWRMVQRGKRVVCCPDTAVWHVGGGHAAQEQSHEDISQLS